MPVRFFAYHGASVDTLVFDNYLRSQGFQKNLSYQIDSLKFDDDALILSTDTVIYNSGLLPNAVSAKSSAPSLFNSYREGNELVCIFSAANQNGEIELYNSAGMKIFSRVVLSGETFEKIDVNNFSSGMYFLRYRNGSISEVHKVIITR